MLCYRKTGKRPNTGLTRFSSKRVALTATAALALHLLFALFILADKAGAELNHQCFIEFKPPHITMQADQVPLGFLLDQITQVTGVHITHFFGIDERPATVDFSKIPLEKGLSLLLKGYNSAWTYTNSKGKDVRLMEVLVVPDAASTINELGSDREFPNPGTVPEYDGEDLAAAEVSSSFEVLNISEIEALLEREQDPALRALLLLQIESPPKDQIERAASVLKSAIQDYDPNIRVAALTSLSAMPQEVVKDSIVEALNDPAPEVRSIAINIAASMSLISPLDLIHRGLADAEGAVRTAAIEAIAGSESSDVLHLLTAAAEDPDGSVRTAALEAIGQLKNGGLDGEPDTAMEYIGSQ